MRIEMAVGTTPWPIAIPDERLLALPAEPAPAIADVRAAVQAAMESPFRLDFPLRRAMTPDDRVALVVDERLPRLGELVVGVLQYLGSVGIGPEAVTLITPSGSTSSDWLEDLPDEFADVHTEAHQPGERKLMSYLAATKQGRRIYLNRTLVDADQIVSICGRRYDPLLGYAGCEGSLYPVLSDTDTRHVLGELLTLEPPTPKPNASRAEAAEIAWLLGSPMFVQVIEGPGEVITDVVAGLIDSSAEGVRLQDARWRSSIPAAADMVLATIGRHTHQPDFGVLAQAAANAARAVRADGIIVLLSDLDVPLGPGMELLRQCENFSLALKLAADKRPVDRPAVFQWIGAATHARIFLASGLRPELVEEIFATPILSPGEVQRLVDGGGTCLYLPDAEKRLVEVA